MSARSGHRRSGSRWPCWPSTAANEAGR
jgi:hypothetical protein